MIETTLVFIRGFLPPDPNLIRARWWFMLGGERLGRSMPGAGETAPERDVHWASWRRWENRQRRRVINRHVG
jgi:hypothetical protein